MLAAGIAHAVVDVDPAPAEGPGLEIAVGTPTEIAALGLLKAGQAAAPGVSLLLPESMDLVQSRITILVSGATEAEIDRGLASLDAQIRAGVPAGTPAGLRALANLKGHMIEPGTPVTFRDLGVSSEDFNGRLYRAAMQIRMPYDYLSADYDKAELRARRGLRAGPRRQEPAHRARQRGDRLGAAAAAPAGRDPAAGGKSRSRSGRCIRASTASSSRRTSPRPPTKAATRSPR